ncbi:hypothetical protein [Alicyclobacillus acidocaldarius]|nr:hypothetical protein [Alicyclobacillus acidocaldarius]
MLVPLHRLTAARVRLAREGNPFAWFETVRLRTARTQAIATPR